MSSSGSASKTEHRNIANNKWRLPIRVLLLTILIAVVGMVGLLALSHNMHIITRNYNDVVMVDYANLEYIDSISQRFYQHQALAFQYMNAKDEAGQRDLIEDQMKQYQDEIEEEARLFGDNVIGTSYETSYHSIASGLNGYFSNIEYIFEFNRVGDSATADYYMENMLKGNIEEVNLSVDELNQLITRDVNEAQKMMADRMRVSRNSAIVLIILLAIFTAGGLSWCIRTSNDIANKDALTQVNNIEKLQTDMNKLERRGKLNNYVCMCTNIKDFTLINQRMSSQVGDLVLRNYAVTIEQNLEKDERIARVGGDNFMILVQKQRIEEFLQFIEKVSVTVEYENVAQILQLESRCGLYAIQEGDSVGVILDAAHLALSQAKHSSAADYIWYETNMLEQAYDRRTLLTEYGNALKQHEFLVCYQPKVNIFTNTLCGCEALVRWQKEDGLVPPFRFIPALEEEGRITELDFYVFEQICKDIRSWLDKGITPVRISSNFSKLHLQNPEFANTILKIVDRYQIESEYLEIELTESSGYEDFKALTDFVRIMNEHEIYVSIDDFGTGYSSLSLLKDLNVDVVKLDKSFIDEIGTGDIMNENLVKNVVHMIKDLNRHVICEGVETSVQADFLRDLDCHMVQGYLYDKPLPHAKFEERLIHPNYEVG